MNHDIDDRLARTLRRDLQDMHAYAVQPSAGLVKLDAMENPFELPAALRDELGARLARTALNRYPAARVEDLRRALAAHVGSIDELGLTLGNGSDELITMLTMACAVPGATVLAPVPSFVMYGVSAALQGLRFVGVPLTPDFELDDEAMLARIAEHRPALVWLACPNNPTANLWDEAAIERIVAAAPGLVVIDEAYQPFASRDAMPLVRRHPHVLVMRTLSKFGLAGVRIGYLVGRRAWIDEIEKVRPPYNISVLNAEAALFALEHAEVYAEQAEHIRAGRSWLAAQLADLPGVHAWPSEANMILVRLPDANASFESMKAGGVLVKNVSALHPLLAGCLRLTVGTPDENRLLIAALKASLR